MKVCKVFVVPHTHWDREWYMEREKSRMMLVDVIDELLYMLNANDDYVFMLDGQTLLLEDYFSIRPDRKQELTGFIKSGRVSIGPWYILPDEFLVSGEAHIRNFLIGDSVCRELGGKMTIGYLPDSRNSSTAKRPSEPIFPAWCTCAPARVRAVDWLLPFPPTKRSKERQAMVSPGLIKWGTEKTSSRFMEPMLRMRDIQCLPHRLVLKPYQYTQSLALWANTTSLSLSAWKK